MSQQNLSAEIRDLIRKNRTEQAIERLSDAQFSRVDKELIILNSQFNRVQEDLRMNVISRDEAERKINVINKSLLELSERVQRGDQDLAATLAQRSGGKSGIQKWWPLLLLPVLAIGIYFIASGGNSNSSGNQESPVVNQDSINDYRQEQDRLAQLSEQRRQDSLNSHQEALEAENRRLAALEEERQRQENEMREREEADQKRQQEEAARRRQDSTADFNRRNPPPPTTIKVKFILRQLEVIKDGDGWPDGAGDFTWEFRVNGRIIERRNSEFGMDDGEKRNFNREHTISLPIESGTINFDALINENDSGGTGDDDIINLSSTYSNQFLRGLGVGQRRNDSKVGTHPDGDPQVRVHWSVIRLE